MRYLLPRADEPNADYAELVSAGVTGPDRFELKREIIDEYGWRNFGDLYADHEAAYYKGPAPIISHYNNQYDAVAGFAVQFMRSGDARWWQQMADLAVHVVDIDLYHTVRDRSIYDHGLFWHSAHYVDTGLSTHRAYPRAPGIYGGGPSNEHNYSAGLMLHYFLTGNPASRDGAVELARWVVDMDNGDKRVFRWLARGDSGFASSTGSPLYNGPGRGAGNSIAVLLNGFRLTGDRAFLAKAEGLIRRCIHPDDDITARDLLNIESRWSYTVFLHSLGRYLDEKVELGEVDATYTYARRSLLVYAHWMVDHEQPYLDRSGELEYPTETWAAQELWKSEVFAFAAKYGDEGEDARRSFLERSDFFFRYAMATLGEMRTRTCTRPMVLLLSRGLMHGYVKAHPDALAAPAGPPLALDPVLVPFVPQKITALNRFRVLAMAAGVVAIATLGVALWEYFG